jgi:hypothetical protein
LLAAWSCIGFTLGGLAAGEGSFHSTRQRRPLADGSPRLRFRFQVAMASRDRPLLEALQRFLGAGSITDRGPARAHWQPISTFSVNSHRAHLACTIPFADAFLLPCAKRAQFERWREQLLEYNAAHPSNWERGRSLCSVQGCSKPVRGRRLCRSHYYRATGY